MAIFTFTSRSNLPRWTQTLIATDVIDTCRPAQTRGRSTLIDVDSAVRPRETRIAGTDSEAYHIHTSTVIIARVLCTVVFILDERNKRI